MSPSALVQRLKELGIEWFAITDHNTMANCPAYGAVAKRNGLYFSWGVEIQTIEEIHLLAYFDDEEAALRFDTELYASLLPLDNDPDFFGDQVIIDENENIIKVEPKALINSSVWDLATAVEKVEEYSGFAIPAHIDAEVNSILSQLGFLPAYPVFELLGITAKLDLPGFLAANPQYREKSFIRASDAHYLSDLRHDICTIWVKEPTIRELRLASGGQDGRSIDCK